jgi:L-ascorbate metabolism protein UlaG (beta-lactamase superfamily)
MRVLTRSFAALIAGILILTFITFLFMQQKSFGTLPGGDRLMRIQQSSNYRDKNFQNLINTPMLAANASYLGMTRSFFSKGVAREPSSPLPVIKTDLKHLNDLPQLIWFGHSSYLISVGGKKILLDPVFSERASPVQYFGMKSYPGTMAFGAEDFPDLDVIVISHDHYDHLDYNTIVALKDRTKLFCVPLGVGSHLEHWGVSPEKIIELDWWEEKIVQSDLKITATPARHFSGRGFSRNRTLWASFVLDVGGLRLFAGGDSGYDDAFKAIGEKFGPFDLALLECGQYDVQWPFVHMMPEETVQASIDLKAKVFMPVHWGKFTLALHPWREPVDRALEHASKLNVKACTPMIGQPIFLTDPESSERWWSKPF